VHDVNLDETYPLLSKYFFKRLICEITRRPVFSRAKTFITPTNVIKKELSIFLNKNRKKHVLAIYEGVSDEFRSLKKFNKNKSFILGMGDFAERKNIKKTLTAYSLLPDKIKQNTSIVIVVSTKGPASKFRDFAKKLGISANAKIVIHPSNSKLVKLFNEAKCFVYPSLYEGFGLPLVEAMACGCPLITSNYGAMKEVAGKAGLLINPSSALNISRAMQKIILSKRVFNTLKKKSLARSKKFNWDTAARETLAAYEKCLRMKNTNFTIKKVRK
jgi:glycosyltransferase involved in cell wall biosynthesis